VVAFPRVQDYWHRRPLTAISALRDVIIPHFYEGAFTRTEFAVDGDDKTAVHVVLLHF